MSKLIYGKLSDAALAPLNADFEKQFGKANLDAIHNAR